MNPQPRPTFDSWTRENLVMFCTEANEVIKRQRELIRLLHQLLATPENSDARKSN